MEIRLEIKMYFSYTHKAKFHMLLGISIIISYNHMALFITSYISPLLVE